MAITVTEGVKIRYAPPDLGFPFAGWWDQRIQGTGDAGGGGFQLAIVPNAPQDRIFRIDFLRLFWEVAIGDEFCKVSIGLSGTGQLAQVASPDMSNAIQGDFRVPYENGMMWRANDPEDVMIQYNESNNNLHVVQLVVAGVFYEPK